MKKVIGLALLLPLVFAGIYRIWFTRDPEPQPAVEILPERIDTAPARTVHSPEPPRQSPSNAPTPPPVPPQPDPTLATDSSSDTPASDPEPESPYSRFEDEPTDPQWSEEHEIMIETFLYGSPGYVDLDIESVTCKSTLCEIKVSERENTVWAKVAHDLTRAQGWESTAWKYADYYDANGKRIIHAIVEKSR